MHLVWDTSGPTLPCSYFPLTLFLLAFPQLFLVRDGLYRNPCVCICVFSVFRIVNETSTNASLAPVIDQLLYTNNLAGALQVYSIKRLA